MYIEIFFADLSSSPISISIPVPLLPISPEVHWTKWLYSCSGAELVTECLDCCQHHGEHHSCGQSVNDDWVHVFAECRFDLSDRRRYWAREWREVFKLEILYDLSCPANKTFSENKSRISASFAMINVGQRSINNFLKRGAIILFRDRVTLQ